ncbi:MAG TPA: YggT family protein [Candidatus Limnocylindria bacterium]|jgi:YggT family protein|nr:YggT family protein [Candidatus Limnocylindria bacterium]
MPIVFVNFLQLLATVLWLLIIARVVVSWMAPMGGGGVVAFIYQATEPLLAPIRRLIPPTAGIDWSPLVALLLLGLITQALTRL